MQREEQGRICLPTYKPKNNKSNEINQDVELSKAELPQVKRFNIKSVPNSSTLYWKSRYWD
jgi:hypothetical protein